MSERRRPKTDPCIELPAEPKPAAAVAPRPGQREPTVQLYDSAAIKEQLQGAMKQALRPVVVVMSGADVGKRVPVSGNATIGRDPGAEVVLVDAGISWHHACLEDRGDAWAVVDLGSTNGTHVGGERCSEALLRSGDSFVLGHTVLRFELRDPVERAYDEEIQRLIDIDELSGLFVRRSFDRELARLMERARHDQTTLAMLAMDMDGVKAINDSYGHLFGAYVIGETGHLIGRLLEGRAIACRFGGDEFVAALPDLDRESARLAAEEVRAAVNAHAFEREGVALRPGISIGVAAFPADAGDAVALFERADQALYAAKQAGKDRVVLYSAEAGGEP